MKKAFKILPFVAILPAVIGINTSKSNKVALAADTLYELSALPTTINLNDYEATDIRSYYAELNGKSEDERKGQNLLKNLKPILMNNQKYFSYDAGNSIWQMYEITDRDWSMSPASEVKNGTYDAATNTITNYVYGKSNSDYVAEANPFVKSYYMDYSIPNEVKAWGDHNQDELGINREHLWPKSEGFGSEESGDKGGPGARGDAMHLVAANGYANNMHNNNFYGYVDRTKDFKDSHDKYAKVGHNYLGESKTSPKDGVKVFEPQDADKGDIARAIFYMAARYNDIAGTDTTICKDNPNLLLTNSLDPWQKSGFVSSQTTYGYMGILSDLLEWNELDPVDEYEIHRNNILCRNFTNNRNPFIDFPEWANIIWGDAAKAANPSSDPINGGNPNTISNFTVANINYGEAVAPTATALSGDVTFGYSRSEKGPFDSTKPTEAGIWYVQATSTAVDDYSADTQVTSFRIIGDPNEISDFVCPNVKVGEEINPTGKAKAGNITFLYSDKEDGPFSETKPTEPGTYYVKAVTENSGKYEAQSSVKSFKIMTAFEAILDSLPPFVLYIIIGVAVLIVLIVVILILTKGKKKTKKKLKKAGKNVASDLGIPIPKTSSSSSSSKTTTKKSSTSSTSKSKSSSSKSSTKSNSKK